MPAFDAHQSADGTRQWARVTPLPSGARRCARAGLPQSEIRMRETMFPARHKSDEEQIAAPASSPTPAAELRGSGFTQNQEFRVFRRSSDDESYPLVPGLSANLEV